jgi:hypothetical protein
MEALDAEPSWLAELELALLDAQVERFEDAGRHARAAAALSASDPFVMEAQRRINRGRRIDPAAFNRMILQENRLRFTRPST